MPRSGVLLASLFAASVACGAALADEAGMTGDQLTALLAGGKTIGLGGPGSGYDGELVLNADGTGSGQAKTAEGDELTLTGTWSIKGDQFCRAWKEFDDGAEVCETWVPDGENRVRVLVNGEEVGVNHW